MMTERVSPAEEKELRDTLRKGGSPDCPRCGAPFRLTPLPPRPDVSYVRKRVLLDCEACGLRVALDRK